MSAVDAATSAMGRAEKTHGLRHRLYNGQTNFEFVRRWKRWMLISAVVIGVGLLALIGNGLKRGIDFTGGTVWELERNGLGIEKARDTVGPIVGRNATIQFVGESRIRIRAEAKEQDRDRVADALAKAAKVDPKDVSLNFVGPSWGKDVSRKAQQALVWFFVIIAGFISLRFQPKMAIAALAAVVHDIAVTVGTYALAGWIFGVEVTPATVIAFLTILGFSLYDTIVVFDKVNENEKVFKASGKLSYTDVVNLSMNQTLMRSLNTSLVAILPIVSLLVLGAGVLGATALGDFGFALLVGLLTGAYSSIFVASPILAFLKEREEVWTAIRKRLSRGSGTIDAPQGAAARLAVLHPGIVVSTVAPDGTEIVADTAVFPGETPRPRKRGRVR